MKLKKTTFLTVVVFCLSFIPLLWFPGKSILLGYDNVYPLDPIPFLYDRIFSWTQSQNFGLDQSGIQGSLIIHFIDSIPILLGAGPQLSQKIVFCFWFFLLLLSPYVLIKRLEKFGFIKTPYLRYIFPILCAFNFYILQAWWIVERTKFSVVIATLFILSVLLPLLKKPLTKVSIIRDSFFCALILSLLNGGGWEGVSLYGGLFVIFGCFYIFFVVHSLVIKNKKRILFLTIFTILMGVWFVLLNFYTFLPFLLTTFKNYKDLYQSAGGIEGLVGWTRYLSANSSILNLLRLQGIPDLYNNGLGHPYAPYYLHRSAFIFASYFFPICLLLAFWRKRKEHMLIFIFFLIALLISMFFTAGTHKPFGFIFEKLMYSVPGFIIFRSAVFKFGYAYWISVSFFIGIFLSELIEYFDRSSERIGLPYFTKMFFPIIVVGLLLFYYFPYFKGDIFRIDQTGVSSRIVIPGYVNDFSSWWRENGKEDRILLLPKLNNSWLYEQYRWGYLSLFPLLKNFGNTGIVENTDLLFQNEHNLLDRLYQAINDGDNNEQELLTSILGIRYFLVRGDFYSDLSNQETDSPKEVEKKLSQNTKISKVAQFGKWSLYKHNEQKPSIFGRNYAIASYGIGFDIPYNIEESNLLLENDLYQKYSKSFLHTTIWPECLSCKAEEKEVEIVVSRPKVLLDSYLYDFIQFREFLKQKSNREIESDVAHIIGSGLNFIAQINELVLQERDEEFVKKAAEELISILGTLYDKVPALIDKVSNPYVSVVTTDQYLQTYDEYINDLISRTDNKNKLIALQKVQFAVDRVRNLIKKFYNIDDFNRRKIYIANITSPGDYAIRIKRNSLGYLSDQAQLEVRLKIDGRQLHESSILDREYINFEKTSLNSGLLTISAFLPSQQSIITSTMLQNIAGKPCFSSFVDDLNPENTYDLQFLAKNTSGNYISLFIDNGQSFAPIFTRYFSPGNGQFNKNRIIVSKQKMPLDVKAKTLRIGFCSPDLTESLFKENIKDLSFTILTRPEITLYKDEKKSVTKNPTITSVKISPTKYRVFIADAQVPFYLILSQRFSAGWEASYGEHLKSNKYSNAWYIDKKGDFEVYIHYKPQSFFSIGLVISIATFFMGLIFIVLTRKEGAK